MTNIRNWSIAARMLLLVATPLGLLFSAFLLYQYYSYFKDPRSYLTEKGALLTSVLADNCEYGVVSGNVAWLRHTLESVARRDGSIYRIEVYDRTNRKLADVTNQATSPNNTYIFRSPIIQQTQDSTDAIESIAEPRLPLKRPNGTPLKATKRDEIGYLEVSMSIEPAIEVSRQRLIAVTFGGFVIWLLSIAAALLLARDIVVPLRKLLRQTQSMLGEGAGAPIEVTTGGEVGELQMAFRDMAGEIQRSWLSLESTVEERTLALRKLNSEIRRLVQKGNAAVEAERKHISIELHDQMNASLIFVRLEAQQIQKLATNEITPALAQKIIDKSRSIVSTTAQLYDSARAITRNLRPETIEVLGLIGSVKDMAKTYQASHQDCKFDVEATGQLSTVTGDLALTAYRLVQEALSNTVKHAKATNVSVRLEMPSDNEQLIIQVADNGIGFDVNAINEGIGLIGMRERVSISGGEMTICSANGQGSVISIKLPMNGPR